ncbi:MAG: hypothetical protein ACFFHV_11465 [Promethearchaeota archaeon]
MVSGNNCQKYQNHINEGSELMVIMRKYMIKYLFFTNVLVVLGPSRIDAGIEILISPLI